MNGDIWLGPNAVLALDREGYKLFDFNLKDMLEIGRFPGIYKLVLRNIRAGIGELWRTFNLNAQVKDLQRNEIQILELRHRIIHGIQAMNLKCVFSRDWARRIFGW